jgi:hypothetical protein
MDYIWCENYPIAIHITEGIFTPNDLQAIANHEQLVVRDMREPAAGDYHPNQSSKNRLDIRA